MEVKGKKVLEVMPVWKKKKNCVICEQKKPAICEQKLDFSVRVGSKLKKKKQRGTVNNTTIWVIRERERKDDL